MSIIATVIGVVILFIRKIAGNKIAPKCNFIIWFVFIIALIFPITIPSKFSIYNYVDIDNIKKNEKEYSINLLELENKMNDNSGQEVTIPKIKADVTVNSSKILKSYLKFIISFVWFGVFIIKLIGAIYSYGILKNGIGNDEIKEERIIEILERCKKKLKIKKKIKIIRQNLIKTPSIVGICDVKILVTDSILELDDISIVSIFMHELSHYKRKDNFLNYLNMVLKSVYWFNPIIKKAFKYIKTDMEFATDQMAISNMKPEEKREYCRVIIKVSGMCSSRVEQVLGMANTAKDLEERIDTIALKEKYEKNSLLISLFTFFIVLLIWVVLYPTSYGMYTVPKLYVEKENGEKIEILTLDENNDFEENTITIGKDETIQLITEGGRCGDRLIYSKIDLNTGKNYFETIDINSKLEECLDTGEYIYTFILNYGKSQSVKYTTKVIIE